MTEVPKIVKPKGKYYDTTDILMGECLMMQGFHKGSGLESILPGDNNQLVFRFELDKVWDTVEDILLGKPMTFTYDSYWKAKMTWQMNLRHFTQHRKNR